MSQSPEKRSPSVAYEDGWEALSERVRSGDSFSGRERNVAFLNTGDGRFSDVSSVLGVDFADDARAVVSCDWNFDGAVDFWTSNRNAPRVRFLKNESAGGSWVAFRLQGVTSNRDAIGARVEVRAGDVSQVKVVTAGDGFLAQSSRWQHFGLGVVESLSVVVTWPGGLREEFGKVEAKGFYELVQGAGRAVPQIRNQVTFKNRALANKEEPTSTRFVMASPIPLPQFEEIPVSANAKLIVLTSESCPNCQNELQLFEENQDQLRQAQVEVVTLNVDEILSGAAVDFPFPTAKASEDLIEAIGLFRETFIERKSPLALPATLLFDGGGNLVAMYQGPHELTVYLTDAAAISSDQLQQRDAAVPFAGRWSALPMKRPYIRYAHAFAKVGAPEKEQSYLSEILNRADLSEEERAELLLALADRYLFAKLPEKARALTAPILEGGAQAVSLNRELAIFYLKRKYAKFSRAHFFAASPFVEGNARFHFNYGLAEMGCQEPGRAVKQFQLSAKLSPNRADTYFRLATALDQSGSPLGALAAYRQAIKLRPGWPAATNNLAWILATHPDEKIRNGVEALRLAQAMVEKGNQDRPTALLTLAVAFAEVGNYDSAVQVIDRAIVIAQKDGVDIVVANLRETRELIRRREAIRMK